MASVLKKQLEKLISSGHYTHLKGVLHGIEKEGLRVDGSGELSQTGHPQGLGSALTNGAITTDYSESLLEFITPVFETPEAAINFLDNLHRFSYQHLENELIWGGSMPCHINNEAEIPIARFGSSNIGQLKHIYRVGLEHRYGKMMQTGQLLEGAAGTAGEYRFIAILPVSLLFSPDQKFSPQFMAAPLPFRRIAGSMRFLPNRQKA